VRLFGRLIGIALLAMALIVSPTFAQPNQIIVATGVPNGTYAQFFTEISRVCPQSPLKGVASHGSVENLERVTRRAWPLFKRMCCSPRSSWNTTRKSKA
jgi:TRAP-type uncharacterized transport system substrate-binding protein